MGIVIIVNLFGISGVGGRGCGMGESIVFM